MKTNFWDRYQTELSIFIHWESENQNGDRDTATKLPASPTILGSAVVVMRWF